MAKVDLTDFTRKIDALTKAYSRVPTEVATIAVNFSKERFREQAWLDQTKQTWKPRKRRRAGSKKRTQTLLVDKGRLKRSIRKIYADSNKIIIGTDVPYAQIHNDGGTINKTVTVKTHNIRQHNRKAHTRTRAGRTEKIKAGTVKAHTIKSHQRKMNLKIPARQFIGESYTLQRRIYLHITARFVAALKS